MEKLRFKRALLFPLLAVLVVITCAGGLGVVFSVINELIIEEWAVVALGVAITVSVPTAAALLERRFGQS